jgi:hypothetical protein
MLNMVRTRVEGVYPKRCDDPRSRGGDEGELGDVEDTS